MRRLIVTILLFFCLSISPAYSYWIWTPKTGKWINPKTAVKSTPKEQFDLAKSLYDSQNHEEAKREFKKILSSFPKSTEAAESQFYLGLIEEHQGNLYEGYLAYQKVIDKYPFSERIAEIIEKEYKIGEQFMEGAKRKAMGVTLPVDNPAIEIFSSVVENSPFGPLAPVAQYKLGLVLKNLQRYYEAEEAFNKVVANYPASEWAEASKFQIASTRASLSKSPEYDQGATKEAKEKFEEFLESHPEAELSSQAKKNIEDLMGRESESNYNIARFYEKQKDYKAAEIYYNEIINSQPSSIWAARSMERLKILETRKR
jgi:outer membrane protein assembly factor BamD